MFDFLIFLTAGMAGITAYALGVSALGALVDRLTEGDSR